jgi:hypothetical protein
MPSAKYSCSGSPLILAKGSTAIDGLSGSGKPAADAAAGSGVADDRAELDQHAVTGGLDDPPAMLGDERIGSSAVLTQGPRRARLVRPISREYPAISAARIAASRREAGMIDPALSSAAEINPKAPPLPYPSSRHRASTVWMTSKPSNSGWPR